MTAENLITRRFKELADKSAWIGGSASVVNGMWIVDSQAFHQWATSALSLMQQVFGPNSIHVTAFRTKFEEFSGRRSNYQVCAGIFDAAKEDYEGGYLFTVRTEITGEVLADFVQLAKAALRDGNKDVAAVLSAAALEDALKRYARSEGLEVDDQVMQQVVNALKAKGLVTGAQKTLLDSMPKLRDYAMHANWDKLAAEDVSSIIGFVEQFLIMKFS